MTIPAVLKLREDWHDHGGVFIQAGEHGGHAPEHLSERGLLELQALHAAVEALCDPRHIVSNAQHGIRVLVFLRFDTLQDGRELLAPVIHVMGWSSMWGIPQQLLWS